jgi:hypothetical protein
VLCALVLPKAHAATQRQVVTVDADTGASAVPRRKRSAVARIAALVAIAVGGVLVVQAGMSSRALLAGQDIEAVHWAPWSTEARERAATDALLQGDAAGAVKQAYAAVTLSPISAAGIRTIGIVESSRGAAGAGNRLMDLAAGLGWRDLITQLWAIDAAKLSNEPQKGLERAEGLFQQHLFEPGLIAILQPPVSPALTSSVVADLEKQPEWRREFLQSGADIDPSMMPAFDALVVQLGHTGAPPTTLETDPLLDRLISLGRIDDARQVWSSVHGNRLVLNGDFERIDTGREGNLPTDWSISTEYRAAVDVGRPEVGVENRALRVYNTPSSAPIVSQRLMLPPGAYVLTFRAHQRLPSVLRWELRCRASGVNIVSDVTPAGGSSWQTFAVNLTVPNQDCAVQRLALKRLGDMHPEELWIDDIVLKAAR